MGVNFQKDFSSVGLIKRLLLWVLVFLQYYPVSFISMPITMRVVISILGITLWIIRVLTIYIPKYHTIIANKKLLYLFIPLLGISLMSIISMNLNGTNDAEFLYYYTTPLLMLSSAYFTISVMHYFYKDKLSFPIIAYYCIGVVFFQLCLGVTMYFNVGIRDFLLTKTKEGLLQLHNKGSAGRLLGFGSFFMNLGVANGVGLLLIGLMLKNSQHYKLSNWMKVKLLAMLIFIAVVGLFQARTTLICDVILLVFMTISSFSFNYGMLRNGILRIIQAVIVAALLIVAIVDLFPEFISSNSVAFKYGFEMFESASEGNGLKTHSSDMLDTMLTIWPTTTKTWLVGDGLYSSLTEGGGYMSTDVGFARLVFYFGIFGMIIYYIYSIAIVWSSFYKITKQSVAFLIYFTIMLLLINLKSFTEYTHYVALFLMLKILYPELVTANQTDGRLSDTENKAISGSIFSNNYSL